MQVILLQRIGRLGQMGDVVTVKDGFARNYLLPQKKALRATDDREDRAHRCDEQRDPPHQGRGVGAAAGRGTGSRCRHRHTGGSGLAGRGRPGVRLEHRDPAAVDVSIALDGRGQQRCAVADAHARPEAVRRRLPPRRERCAPPCRA